MAIEHRSAVNLLQWAKSVYGPRELVGVLASTSMCFDLSVFEIFLPLCCGGRVILVENALCLDREQERNDITLINTVPSVVVELLRTGTLPKSIRTVNLAGEPLRAELVKQIYDLGHIEKIYDLYGPSETTTYSTFTLRTTGGPNTIGRPISNTQVYILDSHLQVVPIGVYGEIYIGGYGLARGYLNHPELTSERFVPHRFSDDPSKRLYRTGDLARYHPDGDIEFLGRADNQVKIRGNRIELGEIEAALNQHPAVKDAVIVLRERGLLREKDLIGYFVPKEPSRVAISELRNFLREKVPDYMVPSLFMQLDALPLSPNGKIDRIALRLPDDTRPEPKQTYVEPRTHVQELLAQIWEEVLRVEAVGIHDNFFELGGHSLLAIQIISRVRETFDKDVPLSGLFDTPTVAGLAVTIEEAISGRADDLPPITRALRDGPLPLSMNQEHLWRLDRMIPGTHFFNIPYVYQLTGNLNLSALEQALREIFRRHEALRTVFAETDGSPVQVIKAVPELEFPHVDLRAESAEEISQKAANYILEERQGPFDLAVGPLVRLKLLRLTNSDYLLLVTMHHIISDYWSMQLFRRELVALYEAFAQGRSSSLPEPTIQFADYAYWERRMITEGFLNKQLEFWKDQLGGPLHEPNLLKKRVKDARFNFRRLQRPIEIEGTLYGKIKTLAARQAVTPFTIVVAALNLLVYLYDEQQDIQIGILTANRSRIETSMTFGHFMNTLVLRSHIAPGVTFKEFLDQTRMTTLNAYAHQELPFEQLARVLKVERGINRDALFRVLLVYKGPAQTVDMPGLTFASVNTDEVRILENLAFTTLDVIVSFAESSTTLTGSVNYRNTRSLRSTIDSMIRVLFLLIESFVSRTDRRFYPGDFNLSGGDLWHGK